MAGGVFRGVFLDVAMMSCARVVRGGAGGVMAVFVRYGSEANGLDYIQRMARRDVVRREVIPCAQLLDGDAEAIGDGNECVVAAHGVALTGSEVTAGGDGDDELIARLDGLGDVIEGSDLGGVSVERLGDLFEGLAVLDDVEAPGGAIGLGNIFEAREKDVARAGREV